MAGNSITVNTDQVEAIAAKLDDLNAQLREQLEEGRNTINNLENIWTGEASQATVSSFGQFANNYFQNYEDVIKQYTDFLRQAVAQGYFDTETANINLADAFK
ncbi:MAG: WXG100 family type VII secretion target [Lachnospiraceae bacterium]|nr:WXG100 family type VII secretion target [Lachnospiraceae bacterium]